MGKRCMHHHCLGCKVNLVSQFALLFGLAGRANGAPTLHVLLRMSLSVYFSITVPGILLLGHFILLSSVERPPKLASGWG